MKEKTKAAIAAVSAIIGLTVFGGLVWNVMMFILLFAGLNLLVTFAISSVTSLSLAYVAACLVQKLGIKMEL